MPEIKIKLLNRLNYLKDNLKEGWDLFAPSYPIEELSYENTKQLIEISDNDILKYFVLFPAQNGTLILNFKGGPICCMSIGNNSFSYISLANNKILKGLEDNFDIEKAKDILEKMVKIQTNKI